MKKRFPNWLILSVITLLVLFFSDCEKPERVIKLTTLEVRTQDINYDQVILRGEITDMGDNPANDHGILFRNLTSSEIDFTEISLGSKSNKGVFTAILTDPLPGSMYEYKAYANTSSGRISGEVRNFTSLAVVIPELTTTVVSEITSTTGASGGNITNDGGSVIESRGICWSTNESPTISDPKSIDPNPETGGFINHLAGLDPGTTYYVRAYASNSAGTAYGNQVSFTTLMEIITGTLTDNRDGTIYNWTQIGDQKWMSENLAFLPEVNTPDSSSYTEPRYYVYGHETTDLTEAINSTNYTTYGVLYNWPAAMAGAVTNDDNPGAIQGVCPDGWHLPGDSEWKKLEIYLGMSLADANLTGPRGDIGGTLKEEGATHWSSPNTGVTNFTQFTALPGGKRDHDNAFISLSYSGFWWNSRENDADYAFSRMLGYNVTSVSRDNLHKEQGLSVRCVEGQGANLPVVVTNPPINITQTGAMVEGNASDDAHGFITERGIFYVTVDEPPQLNGTKVSLGTDVGTFSIELTGLTEGQTYYFSAFATNVAGTSYGDVESFITTLSTLPTLTTIDASNITTTSVTSGGDISGDGGSEVFDRGVCYNTSPNPTISDNIVQDGVNGIGTFNCIIDNLTQGTIYYIRAFATNSVGTAYGNEISITTLASGGTVSDADGNEYQTIILGTQTWMGENLKTTKYNDASAIPLVADASEWSNLTTPGYCWYNNDEVGNKDTYGALYNWYSVNTGILCPTGWHVPTHAEWTILTDFLGGSVGAGGKLKEAGTTHWDDPNEGATNESGFTALPGGARSDVGLFYNITRYGGWWCHTEYDGLEAWYRKMAYTTGDVSAYSHPKKDGYSVRCLKD